MPQLYSQLSSRPGPWLLGRTSAGLCTLQTACPLTVTYSSGAADTVAAGAVATVYGGSAAQFDASADVWVVLTVQGSGALQVAREADLATVTGGWAGLARIVQHSTEPYQPQAYLASGGLGTGGASTTTVIPSATAAGRYFLLGSAPAAWQTLGFNDSAWTPTISDGRTMPYSGAQSETFTSGFAPGQDWLYRRAFALPAGVVSAATLHCCADDLFLGIWINDILVYTSPNSAASDFAHDPAPAVNPSVFVTGGSNQIAIQIQNINATTSLAYRLDVTTLGSGGVPAPGSPSEGDLLCYQGGAWVSLPLGTSGQELTVVGGEPAWATPAAGYSDPLTTKGDLVARSASATVRLGVGSNGQVITADSTATDGLKWATPAASGVTSIDVAAPAPLASSGGPITASGTVTLSWASGQTANRVLASPDGSSGAVSLRALVGADIPVDASTIIASSGVIKGNYQAGSGVSISGNTISATGSGGSVTSVALSVPSILSVSGSPITGAGTLAVSLATQSANRVFAGPASGSAAAPTFRALQGSDLPAAAGAGGHVHAHVHLR